MAHKRITPGRAVLIWAMVLLAALLPIAAAAFSPLLAWRDPVYVLAGFAGIVGLALMLVQPLLAAGYLPGLPAPRGRRVHRLVGAVLVLAVATHVIALWITSPPDVVDALLFRSPTQFSVWGVIAMWTVFAAALLAALRRRVHLRVWRLGHTGLVTTAVVGTILHALLIEGTMETGTKLVLCALVMAAVGKVVFDLRAWAIRSRRGT